MSVAQFQNKVTKRNMVLMDEGTCTDVFLVDWYSADQSDFIYNQQDKLTVRNIEYTKLDYRRTVESSRRGMKRSIWSTMYEGKRLDSDMNTGPQLSICLCHLRAIEDYWVEQ